MSSTVVQGSFLNASADTLKEELSLDRLKALADEVRSFKPLFYLWGGEPFLYRDLIPFLEYLQQRRIVAAINTNGTFLEDKAEDLVRVGVANLLISVDGPREVHDKVRGREGTYDKVMAGVDKLLEVRKRHGAATPYVTFVTTVNPDNVNDFPKVYDIAAERGIDFMGLQFGTFTTPETGMTYEQRMKSELGCEATSWKGFLSYDSSALDVPTVQEGLRQVRSRKHPFGTYFVPDLQPEDLPNYYTKTAPLKSGRKCIVPWMRADILPNGDVYPCIDYPDYIVGNINETPLMELWNGERYVKFRQALMRGLFGICGRCQSLYEF